MTKYIDVVGCCFTLTPAQFKDRLIKLAKDLDVEMRGVIVSNNTHLEPLNDSNWSLVKGSNKDLDWSAYIEGVNVFRSASDTFSSCILFLNDSLFTSHNAKANLRPILNLLPLAESIDLPCMVGKADRYFTICHSNPWGGQNFYISTYCFILNSEAITIINRLPSLADEDGLGHTIDIASPNWGGGLRPAFREFLRANMAYINSPYAWHSLLRYSNNKSLLRSKARCIYFEHRLSGELVKNGCVMPINTSIRKRMYLQLAEAFSRFLIKFQ
jgi:hypothetical protein